MKNQYHFGGNTIDTIKTEEIKRKFKHYAETEIVKINTEINKPLLCWTLNFVGL